MKRLFAMSMLIVAGCASTPVVEPTKPWEGHYMTVKEFNAATTNITLEKKESIWVLSNTTLNRLIRNAK